MHTFKNMTIKGKLLALVAICLAGLIGFGLFANSTLNTYKIGGEEYQKIVNEKDLIADIAPPPMYIIESYLTVLEILNESHAQTMQEQIAKLRKLKADYEQRHSFWGKNIHNEKLAQLINVQSHEPVAKFFDVMEKEFLPAIEKGDKAKAASIAEHPLGEFYDIHRKFIDSAVEMEIATSKEMEEKAIQTIESRAWMQMGFALFIATMTGLVCWIVIRQISGPLNGSVKSISEATSRLMAVGQELRSTASDTSQQAGVVSASADQVSRAVQTVASGMEEMSASVSEIAKNSSDAARVANEAVNIATMANTSISKLGASSTEIGEVVKVITSIAEQTKLLALNATIEAARAGEAGKGFAVVANEVKELAKQTAKATEEISQKIGAIQTDTKTSVEAIGEISKIIGQVNSIQNTIASAVEEQTATTNEIARTLAEAAQGTSEIASNISRVAQATQDTSSGTSESLRIANELPKVAQALRHLISKEGGDDLRFEQAA